MAEHINSPLSRDLPSFIYEQDSWLSSGYGPLYVDTPSSSTPGQRQTVSLDGQINVQLSSQPDLRVGDNSVSLSSHSQDLKLDTHPRALLLATLSPVSDPVRRSDTPFSGEADQTRIYGTPTIHLSPDLIPETPCYVKASEISGPSVDRAQFSRTINNRQTITSFTQQSSNNPPLIATLNPCSAATENLKHVQFDLPEIQSTGQHAQFTQGYVNGMKNFSQQPSPPGVISQTSAFLSSDMSSQPQSLYGGRYVPSQATISSNFGTQQPNLSTVRTCNSHFVISSLHSPHNLRLPAYAQAPISTARLTSSNKIENFDSQNLLANLSSEPRHFNDVSLPDAKMMQTYQGQSFQIDPQTRFIGFVPFYKQMHPEFHPARPTTLQLTNQLPPQTNDQLSLRLANQLSLQPVNQPSFQSASQSAARFANQVSSQTNNQIPIAPVSQLTSQPDNQMQLQSAKQMQPQSETGLSFQSNSQLTTQLANEMPFPFANQSPHQLTNQMPLQLVNQEPKLTSVSFHHRKYVRCHHTWLFKLMVFHSQSPK